MKQYKQDLVSYILEYKMSHKKCQDYIQVH